MVFVLIYRLHGTAPHETTVLTLIMRQPQISHKNIQHYPSTITPSMAVMSRKKPASAGTSRDNHGTQKQWKKRTVLAYNLLYVVCCCLFSWRYNPFWLYFHSPVAGFNLLVFEVSWSHTTTRHSR